MNRNLAKFMKHVGSASHRRMNGVADASTVGPNGPEDFYGAAGRVAEELLCRQCDDEARIRRQRRQGACT